MSHTSYMEVVGMKKVKIFGVIVFSLVFLVAFQPPIPVYAVSGDTVVYVTKTGEKYHADGCRYLRKSKIEKSLEDAVDDGYKPCSVCKAPKLSE